MNIVRGARYWNNGPRSIVKPIIKINLQFWVILLMVISSCKTDQNSFSWFDENSLTISQYLDKHKNEYSKFYQLLADGKMLNTLYAYNPYGNGYTLFLPTDEAIDHFIAQHPKYGSLEQLLKDTSLVKMITRYHTVNKKLRTHEFPDGALIDSTLTKNRLVASFFGIDNKQVIKINNVAPIIRPNLELTNGYIHVISEVLLPPDLSGYDWLYQQKEYSILAKAMELSEIPKKLKWNHYTIFAEPDSVYHRLGINTVEDLIGHLAASGMPLNSADNPFYQFTSYHILKGEYYMNDFPWGSKEFLTLSDQLLTISIGQDIKINPGVDKYGITLSASGDTTVIDYIRPIPESCNMLTRTGPVHSISDLMYYQPLEIGLK